MGEPSAIAALREKAASELETGTTDPWSWIQPEEIIGPIEAAESRITELAEALTQIIEAHDRWWDFLGSIEDAENVEMELHDAIDNGRRRAQV